MTLRDAILVCLHKEGFDINDDPFIVENEWHYLVACEFYVSKKEVARVLKAAEQLQSKQINLNRHPGGK